MPRSQSYYGFLLLQLSASISSAVCAQSRTEPDSVGYADFQKFSALRTFMRNRNAQYYAITAPNGIDEGKFVEIGGIEQWITIRGEDRNNPVLLFLHGGPGDATNPWSFVVFRSWLKDFTVVQWDQRGTGRTLGRSGPSIASTLTVDRLVKDGIELAELLRKDLQKDKIILVGHSWGSILGVLMAKARPDLLYAYVGTAQVADELRNYAVAYADLLRKAEATHEQQAVVELKAVGPPPYEGGRGYAVQRKWSNLFEGADLFIPAMLGIALGAPGYSMHDINDWLDGQNLSGQRLFSQTSTLDSKALGGEFAVPVFVIQGAEDFTTPTGLARTFLDSIRAPRKAFVEIAGGHFAVFMKSEVFLKELVARVRPLAVRH
jgi:pimeloyl-ACP methyl ester carboxylesterase